MTTASAILVLTPEMLFAYQTEATRRGFPRKDPTKCWTEAEQKEAMRYVVRLWHINFCKAHSINMEVPHE